MKLSQQAGFAGFPKRDWVASTWRFQAKGPEKSGPPHFPDIARCIMRGVGVVGVLLESHASAGLLEVGSVASARRGGAACDTCEGE